MLSPAVLGQTITVVDKSNKVISNSKHLLNVFKEAKSAYRERKAEISASRHAHTDEKHVRKALKAHMIDDGHSSVSRPSSRRDSSHRKPVSERQLSGGARSITSSIYPASDRRFEQDLQLPSPRSQTSPTSPRSGHREMVRRHTTIEDPPTYRSAPPSPVRSRSYEEIDMNLAYGEAPHDLIVTPRSGEEVELKGLVGTVKRLLQEADCVQYSVTAMVANLQKNPEAMAAVALTLAEISSIVSKMAPGAVLALKGSAPAVFALLASPQFMIAAGVGVGVTIVAFGGYKIIKKIKAKQAVEEPGMDEMIELGGELSRIENWRRGISEAAEGSVGTSVEGEFITPYAANLSRLNLREDGLKSVKGKSSKGSKANESSKGSKTTREGRDKKKKEKKPSPLRLMFS